MPVAADGCGPSKPSCSPVAGQAWSLVADAAGQFAISRRPRGGTLLEMRWRLPAAGGAPGTAPAQDGLPASPSLDVSPEVSGGIGRRDPEAA